MASQARKVFGAFEKRAPDYLSAVNHGQSTILSMIASGCVRAPLRSHQMQALSSSYPASRFNGKGGGRGSERKKKHLIILQGKPFLIVK